MSLVRVFFAGIGMLGNFVLSFGVLGFGWWLTNKWKNQHPKAKIISKGQNLSTRQPGEISVVTYNLLSDTVVRNTSEFAYANPVHISWDYRWTLIKKDLECLKADLFCMQEVETDR